MNTYEELYHHGIKGMRWGIRRFQNKDGSLTPRGQKRRDQLDSQSDANSASSSASRKKGLSKNAKIALGVALGVAGATAIGVVAAKNLNREKKALASVLNFHNDSLSSARKSYSKSTIDMVDRMLNGKLTAKDTLRGFNAADTLRNRAESQSRSYARQNSHIAKRLSDDTLDRLANSYGNTGAKFTNRDILRIMKDDRRNRRRNK